MTTKIIFNRKNKLNNHEQGLIEFEIYISKANRKFRSTKIWVEEKHWDERNKLIKKSHPDFENLNNRITIQKMEIDKFLLNQRMNNESLDIRILEKRNKQHNNLFFEYFENETMAVSNTILSKGTNLIYARALKYLKEYSKDLPLENVSVTYLEGFNKFLIEQKFLAINTRATLFNKIKKVLGAAVKNDLLSYSKNPFNRGFAVKEIDTDKKSLTLAELKRIEALDISLRPELDRTRDMFLLSCYTSLRFGDLVSLSFENFELLENGKIRLKYTPNKTKNSNNKRIEWIVSDFWGGKVDAIIHKYLEKYKPFRADKLENRLFFDFHNTVYNRTLKELQRFAGIEENLTSHLGRHTCITLLINDFGLDITKAQLIAGHSKIEMTRKYLRITDNDLSDASKRIDWGR